MTGSTVAECCPPLLDGALSEADAEQLSSVLKVLADPARLRVLSILAAHDDAVCACDLVAPVGRSQPTVSHHLKVLHDAGLVTREKRGTWVWYAIVPERLESLRNALARPARRHRRASC